jgi:EpsI family protein
MTRRMLIASAILLLSSAYVAHASKTETVPARQPLAMVPVQLGEWQSGPNLPFSAEITKVLGVDDYINRVYTSSQAPFVSLYVGYYRSQRQGDTIHSPLNCLPGAGWQPIVKGRAEFTAQDASGISRNLNVNEFVIQKGLERQLVLYWYQSHGRVVANEYASKIFMVYDAMRLNRTDAALVRVITPIAGDDDAAQIAASQRARSFVQALFPALTTSLPG